MKTNYETCWPMTVWSLDGNAAPHVQVTTSRKTNPSRSSTAMAQNFGSSFGLGDLMIWLFDSNTKFIPLIYNICCSLLVVVSLCLFFSMHGGSPDAHHFQDWLWPASIARFFGSYVWWDHNSFLAWQIQTCCCSCIFRILWALLSTITHYWIYVSTRVWKFGSWTQVGNSQPKPLQRDHDGYPMAHEAMSLEEFEMMSRKHEIAIAYLATPKRERATAGTILQRSLYEIEKFRSKMTRSLCVFKLGLTTNPIIRFKFYRDDNYSHMALLHVTENAGVAQMLEASLIAIHMSQTGCRNEKHGFWSNIEINSTWCQITMLTMIGLLTPRLLKIIVIPQNKSDTLINLVYMASIYIQQLIFNISFFGQLPNYINQRVWSRFNYKINQLLYSQNLVIWFTYQLRPHVLI